LILYSHLWYKERTHQSGCGDRFISYPVKSPTQFSLHTIHKGKHRAPQSVSINQEQPTTDHGPPISDFRFPISDVQFPSCFPAFLMKRNVSPGYLKNSRLFETHFN
jgi:hypothetical protein